LTVTRDNNYFCTRANFSAYLLFHSYGVTNGHHDDSSMFLLCRFAVLASRMEQYIQGQSRDLIDKAYTKLVSITPFKFAPVVVHM
jgi:hypothetical protein